MKRNFNAAEKSAFRPLNPATFTQPEPEVHQALAEPAADALIEPPATEHAPMAFPGPYAHVPRPLVMQASALEASSASSASSGQGGGGQAVVVLNSTAVGQGRVQVESTLTSDACSTSTTSSASVAALDASGDNPRGFPPLILAASRGRLADLERLLQDPATDINQLDLKNSFSALMAAASKGHMEILARLIAAGAVIDLSAPPIGGTALHAASISNKPRAIACLLKAGAKVNLATGPRRETALIYAVRYGRLEAVNLLVKHKGIALDLADADGLTALHHAAISNKPEVVQCLLAAGAQVNLETNGKRTELLLAASMGHVEVMNALLARTDILIDARDATGMNALHVAADQNQPGAAACLLAAGANMISVTTDGSSALVIAVRKKHAAVLEVLSQHGAALPDVSYDRAQHAYCVTVADLAADLAFPADPQQNPLGLAARGFLDSPLAAVDELVAVFSWTPELLPWLRAKGIRMASALPVVECLSALASTWPKLANNAQAATAQQKRLVCAAALSRLPTLTGKGQALEGYTAAGISAAGRERLSAVATRQIEKIIALSEQVMTSFASARLDTLMRDCLARTSLASVDAVAMQASLVREGWLEPVAQAVVRAWTSALVTLDNEPLTTTNGSTVKQAREVLLEHIERNAPRHFALAMQRELDAPTLIAALRTWIGGATAAEAYHQLFQIQCDQLRQYCEQLGTAI